MRDCRPATRGPKLTRILDRLVARGTTGWRVDGWNFAQQVGPTALRLGRVNVGSPLVRLDVVPAGNTEPVACIYSTDDSRVETLLTTLERASALHRREAARVLDALLAELDALG